MTPRVVVGNYEQGGARICSPSVMMVKGWVTGKGRAPRDGASMGTTGASAIRLLECISHWQAVHSGSDCDLVAEATRYVAVLPLALHPWAAWPSSAKHVGP